MTAGAAAGVLVRALAIAGLAGVVGLGHSLLRETPIRLTLPPRQAPPSDTPPRGDGQAPADAGADHATGGYDPDAIFAMSPEELLDAGVLPGMITLRQASALYDEGAVFLDARRHDEYLAGHVEGAVWMPAEEVAPRVGEIMHAVGMPIVIYCEGGACDASHNTANRLDLTGMGFDPADIRIMGLGYEEWERAGLPTAQGEAP